MKKHQKTGGNHDKYTPETAALGVNEALKTLEGRWKLFILFQLFGKIS